MNSTEKKELERNMKLKLEKFSKEIEMLRELTKPIAPDTAIGRISRMDAINNKSVNEAALRKKEAQLKGLNYAFSNLNSPTFGKCIRCGKDIPIGRIMLMPESKKCVICAGM